MRVQVARADVGADVIATGWARDISPGLPHQQEPCSNVPWWEGVSFTEPDEREQLGTHLS